MSGSSVPKAAVEAAWRADMLRRMDGRDRYREVLTAAAPHIAADTLRRAAEELQRALPDQLLVVHIAAWLRKSADDLDGRQPTPDTREGILAAVGLTEADMADEDEGPDYPTITGGLDESIPVARLAEGDTGPSVEPYRRRGLR